MEKPNIQELFDAMQRFALDVSRTGYNPKAFQDARDALRARLEALGIADAFNWDEIAG